MAKLRFKLKYQDSKTLGIQYIGNPVTCFRLLNETTKGGNQKQSYVCTISRWDTELPEHAVRLLTEVEIGEWKAWKKSHDAGFRRKQLEASLNALPLTLRYAAAALAENAPTANEAQTAAIWSALDAFTRALEKAGVERPPRGRGRPPAMDLPAPEEGLPIMSNLDQLGSPLECAYRSLVERYKALQARSKLSNENDDIA